MVSCRRSSIKLTLLLSGLFLVPQAFASNDPTAPLNWTSPNENTSKKVAKIDPVPTLQSIVCREKTSCYAVLNDVLVKVNDSISGYKVKEISPKEVIVVRGSKTHELALFQSDIKK